MSAQGICYQPVVRHGKKIHLVNPDSGIVYTVYKTEKRGMLHVLDNDMCDVTGKPRTGTLTHPATPSTPPEVLLYRVESVKQEPPLQAPEPPPQTPAVDPIAGWNHMIFMSLEPSRFSSGDNRLACMFTFLFLNRRNTVTRKLRSPLISDVYSEGEPSPDNTSTYAFLSFLLPQTIEWTGVYFPSLLDFVNRVNIEIRKSEPVCQVYLQKNPKRYWDVKGLANMDGVVLQNLKGFPGQFKTLKGDERGI